MAGRRLVTAKGDYRGSIAATPLLNAAIFISALYFAREILIPISLAVLISFVLTPFSAILRKLGVPRVLAVFGVVLATFGAILGIGVIGSQQISQLAQDLPQYEEHIRGKIRSLRGTAATSGAVSEATSVIEGIGQELAGGSTVPGAGPSKAAAPGTASTASTPIPVEIKSTTLDPFTVASNYLFAILSPVADTLLVILFVIFFMLQQDDLRARVIRLLGVRDLHRTTEAMHDAAKGLSRYLMLQTIMNASSGLVIGLGLWYIGLPSPLLWGIFLTLLRFVPYAGAIIAAVLPIALAAAVDPGWTMAISAGLLFLVVETIVGQFVEPFVYGRQTGLSPVAILVAATFWTWLWGPIGLILATPLTMCLSILGQYTKRLEFLHVLLGDQPALSPIESFYQRLIAGDPAEIIDQADAYLKTHDLTDYCDAVALPALVLVQHDAATGELSLDRQALLLDGVNELVDGLRDETAPDDAIGNGNGSLRPVVMCTTGRGLIDEASSSLLIEVLRRNNINARIAEAAEAEPPAAIVVCIVGQAREVEIRIFARRARRLAPRAKLVIGWWQAPFAAGELELIRAHVGADAIGITFREVLQQLMAKPPEDRVEESAAGKLAARGDAKATDLQGEVPASA